MSKKVIHVDRIGDVTFQKNKRSKNVTIAIKPITGIVVNMPYFVSYGFAKSIVERKRNWILTHLPKIELLENRLTIFTPETEFFTKYRRLVMIPEKIETVKTKINSEQIIIKYPDTIDIRLKEIQDIVKKIIIKTLRIEAKSYLPARTELLAKKYQFKFKNTYIKNNKTIWGSCSGQNNINLNLHLMRLPDHLIDYVIIHELCHTIEKNHGKGFWKLMDSILGDAKSLSKELKNYSTQIY